jgi:hypothetical protein
MKKIILLFLAFLALVNESAFPQNRGKYSFATAPAPPLMQNISMPRGHYSSKGLSGVGGISFDKIAHPAKELGSPSLVFYYDPRMPDGNRFHLEIDNKKVVAPIHDWMLIPIVRYTNSGYNSCFTYFGQLEDKADEKIVRDNEGHILNYHPDFFNTLLGLRLADMDLLLMYDFAEDPPKRNGQYVLGASENHPDVSKNENGLYRLINNLNTAVESNDQMYRSYLISDYKQDIAFYINKDTLAITGYPYYYCWRYAYDNADFSKEKLTIEISQELKTEISKKMKSENRTERDVVLDLLLESANKYEGEYNFYQAGTIVELIQLPKQGDQRRNYMQNYGTEDLKDAIIDMRLNMAAYTAEFLEQLSDRISQPNLFEEANPLVWNATVMTMRYSAFFRYLKAKYPQKWLLFCNSIKDQQVKPVVSTPTVMYPSGNKAIQKILYGSQ